MAKRAKAKRMRAWHTDAGWIVVATKDEKALSDPGVCRFVYGTRKEAREFAKTVQEPYRIARVEVRELARKGARRGK
jgi:hypothetical protein